MIKKKQVEPSAEQKVRETICPGCRHYIGVEYDNYSMPGRPLLRVSCAAYRNAADEKPGAWVRPGQCRTDALIADHRGDFTPRREQMPVFGVSE